MNCQACNRPVQIDPLNGRRNSDRGYCVGFSTCLRRPESVDKLCALGEYDAAVLAAEVEGMTNGD